jgi:hypothetical protein
MAPGLFEKIFDIVKKPFEFVKEKVFDPVIQRVVKPLYQKVVKPVYTMLKPALKPVLQTVLQMKGIPAPASDLLFEGGEGLADHFLGEKEETPPASTSRRERPVKQEIVEQPVYVDENGNPISEEDLRSGKYVFPDNEVMSASAPAPKSAVDLMRSNLRGGRRKK